MQECDTLCEFCYVVTVLFGITFEKFFSLKACVSVLLPLTSRMPHFSLCSTLWSLPTNFIEEPPQISSEIPYNRHGSHGNHSSFSAYLDFSRSILKPSFPADETLSTKSDAFLLNNFNHTFNSKFTIFLPPFNAFKELLTFRNVKLLCAQIVIRNHLSESFKVYHNWELNFKSSR